MVPPRRRVRALAFGGAVGFAAVLTARGAPAVGITLAPGDLAPPLAAPALTGWKYRANWRDYPLTVVNFWASWCEPCRVEMPILQELYAKHGRKNLAVVGVVLDPATDGDVSKFAEDLGVSYTLVRGSSELSNIWGGIAFLPTTFLVSHKGNIVRRYVGATTEQVEALKADVEAFLAERSQKPTASAPVPPPQRPRH